MDRLQSNSEYSKKSQEQQNVRPVTNNRAVLQSRYQKQYLNGSKKLGSYLTGEVESLAITCSSKRVERNRDIKTSAQVPVRETRKQAVENVSIKSSNNNFILHNENERIECYETRGSSRIQKSNLCPKPNKSYNLPENINMQNVKQESKSKSVQKLDNTHAHALQDISTKVENSCMPNGGSFDNFEFIDLLHYNIDLMQHEQLLKYAFALKSRILKNIFEFKDCQKDELDFLFALTDGSQTDKNQKLIIRRICFIIGNIVEKTSQNSNISNSNCNTHKQRFSVHSQNSGLIPRIDGLNILSKYDDKKDEQVILNKNLDYITYAYDKETAEERNFHTDDDSHKISSVKTLTNNTWETEYVVEEFLENNNTHVNTTESISENEMTDEESPLYGSFRLENLLNYDIEKICGNSLFDYAFSLKKRVLENIFVFKYPEREKLEFLCELTDGTQLEVNQKLITTRMYSLVDISRQEDKNIFVRHPGHSCKPRRQ